MASAVAAQAATAPDQSTAYQGDPGHDGNIAGAAYSSSLTQLWSASLPGAGSYPVIAQGLVFVTTAGGGGGGPGYGSTLEASSASTGQLVWSHPLGGTYYWSGLTYDGGRIFTVNGDGLLTAYDAASGTLDWSAELPGQYSFSSPPTASNAGEVGDTLVVGVTATNGAGASTTVLSPSSAPMLPPAPTDVTPPSITGSAVQGTSLQASPGTWNGSPTSFTYQWERRAGTCSPVSGATGSSYALTSADLGDEIEVSVTAVNAGGASQPEVSAATSAVVPPPPVNTQAPAVSGVAQVGDELMTSEGLWTNTPTSYTVSWQRCDASGDNCVTIDGATSFEYEVQSADVGSTLRSSVITANAGGSSAVADSAVSSVIVAPPPPTNNTTPPSITGTPAVGSTLSVSVGTWAESPDYYTVQWLA
jgi:hypothetical protein